MNERTHRDPRRSRAGWLARRRRAAPASRRPAGRSAPPASRCRCSPAPRRWVPSSCSCPSASLHRGGAHSQHACQLVIGSNSLAAWDAMTGRHCQLAARHSQQPSDALPSSRLHTLVCCGWCEATTHGQQALPQGSASFIESLGSSSCLGGQSVRLPTWPTLLIDMGRRTEAREGC